VLQIHKTSPDELKLLGVTWIGCLGISPFEIDVELIPGIDTHFATTIFRIGILDDFGRPKILDRRMNPRRALEMRPSQNRHWAMAVELTPLSDQPIPPA
jgi:hypothetical protein